MYCEYPWGNRIFKKPTSREKNHLRVDCECVGGVQGVQCETHACNAVGSGDKMISGFYAPLPSPLPPPSTTPSSEIRQWRQMKKWVERWAVSLCPQRAGS